MPANRIDAVQITHRLLDEPHLITTLPPTSMMSPDRAAKVAGDTLDDTMAQFPARFETVHTPIETEALFNRFEDMLDLNLTIAFTDGRPEDCLHSQQSLFDYKDWAVGKVMPSDEQIADMPNEIGDAEVAVDLILTGIENAFHYLLNRNSALEMPDEEATISVGA